MLWLLESGLVAIARLLLYLRLLGQDTKRPAPSGDEPLDLSEPEDWGEASPFESRQAPRTKADLLNEIRQRTDRLTGQREAEQRQIDPWSAQPPQRRGHGR